MRFVLLLVAAAIAVIAGVAALKWTGSNAPKPAQTGQQETAQQTVNVSTVEVLVARQQIPVGSVISEAMIARQPWPSHLVLESFVVADSPEGNVVGKVARSTFMPQEPLLRSRLGNPNDPSFLAATLPAGVRAVTIATDAIAGVAGYIFPGDRVDVLLTHNAPEALAARGTARPAYSEVLVANARVLAVNLRDPGYQETARPSVVPSSVTIAIPEAVVQQLRLAERLGSLSLALRSLKDIDKFDAPAPTGIGNITQVNVSQSGTGGVRIVRGVKSDSSAMNGSQVSLREMQPTLNEDPSLQAGEGINP